MTTLETPSRLQRRLRYVLITLGAFALTVALFYAEEDWRGWRAMEKGRRQLTAQGFNLDWNSYTSAPVPESENIFGVPAMQESFTGHGVKPLTKKWPPLPANSSRMTLAQLTIGLPGATPPIGTAVLQGADPGAKTEMLHLIQAAIGPVALNPAGGMYPKQSPENFRPVQIFLQCQSQPAEKNLQKLVPEFIFQDWDQDEKIKVEQTGDNSFNLTMPTPVTAAEFLKLSEGLEPDFSMIRDALQRPYARMNGDYSDPVEAPIPAFVTIRTIAQRLGAMAECHLLLGQPEKALDDLTLTHDICHRILEENKPMTLVSAMINVAVRGLDAGIIADGLEMHEWREPQLAKLEAQLKQLNLLEPVYQAFVIERAVLWHELSMKTPAQLDYLMHSFAANSGGRGRRKNPHSPSHPFRDKVDSFIQDTGTWMENSVRSLAWKAIPRGWAYQNMVVGANLYGKTLTFIDPPAQLIFPTKAKAAQKQAEKVFSHWSPYNFLAADMIPNITRASQTTAHNQTEVNQTLIACALERYRLAHGEYPEALDALLPQYIDAIPHDTIGGQPPTYRRKADGTFLLYSIGWDEQDHGGESKTDFVWPEK